MLMLQKCLCITSNDIRLINKFASTFLNRRPLILELILLINKLVNIVPGQVLLEDIQGVCRGHRALMTLSAGQIYL